MKKLFISDLHLDPRRTDIQDCFDRFIASCLANASEIDALYVLGDLFDLWIGDDASIPVNQHSIKQLKKLSTHGIKLYIMHGNRDFLMSEAFEQASACKLIPDLYHLENTFQKKNQTILLSHGDIFCTDDEEYMQFRTMVRDPLWKKEFLSKKIPERVHIARAMRQQSMQLGQEKQAEIMDVNQKTIARIMSEQGVNTLIHGHTHRPATHEFILNNQAAKRIVLPDWNPDAQALVIQ